MGFLELFLVGVGLSMDAFAVSVCKGLSMKKLRWRDAALLALFFGGFQALMPFIGWVLGSQFEQYITSVDHWIAFALLAIIGGKMILDVIKERGEETKVEPDKPLGIREVLVLAVATSIDALAMGITFAFLQVKIVPAISLIGITTACLSLVGVLVGHKFGAKYQEKAQLAGGIVLVLLGVKILLEHLGLLPF